VHLRLFTPFSFLKLHQGFLKFPILCLGRYNYNNQDATPAPRSQIAKASRVSQGYYGWPEVSKENIGTIHVDTTPLLVLAIGAKGLHEGQLKRN
jgi:hypothetical protein